MHFMNVNSCCTPGSWLKMNQIKWKSKLLDEILCRSSFFKVGPVVSVLFLVNGRTHGERNSSSPFFLPNASLWHRAVDI
jgi:hypothetical protein